jgi:hypothetical protein
LRGIAFPAVAVTPSTDKDLRIMSLQPHVNNGLIRLHRNQGTMIEQLKFYPEADHDDGPDALEMLWSLAVQYGGEWEYTGVSNKSSGKQDSWVDRAMDAVGDFLGFGDEWDD